MSKPVIFFAREAETDLDAIYEYYFENSPAAANSIVDNIIAQIETLVFEEQFQVEPSRPDCRRIIAGHYKILYQVTENSAYIIRIFDSRRDSAKL